MKNLNGIVVFEAGKLIARIKSPWTFNELAGGLHMSPSQVHAAAKRALRAKLAVEEQGKLRPNIRNLLEFLSHGLQYVFVPELGELVRGQPTAHAAPPMHIRFPDAELPPVWPKADAKVRGLSFSPLYKAVPKAATEDAELYAALALVDAIRGGRAREKAWALKELGKQLSRYDKSQ